MYQERKCIECGKIFYTNRNRRYCGTSCSVNSKRKTRNSSVDQKRHYSLLISASTIGAFHELIVSTDLMKKGMHVFRALSPRCPCDLALLHNNKLYRVEVTTAHLNKNGTLGWSPHNPSDYDILALVMRHDASVVYYQNEGLSLPL